MDASASSQAGAVVVVGAGPTGLLAAAELQAGGVRTIVLERRAEQESNLTRAFAVHARTLEILDACGLADELVARGTRVDQVRLFSHIDVRLSRLPSRFPYVLITPQYQTERVLREYAARVGVEIRRGSEVTSLSQDADAVSVQVRSRDGTTSSLRAAYVVGADGAHSTVRQALSMPFPGHESKIGWLLLADVRLADEPPQVLAANGTGEDFAFVAPFGDGWFRVFAWNRHMAAPGDTGHSLETIREITRRAIGTDFGMHDARWISRFHNDERQVPQYRNGRVLLAGDAAHVHSPAGGQGMNLGMQDAANLGWKLAAVASGHAHDALLATYQAERHPVGRNVVVLTERLVELVILRNPLLRAARDALGSVATSLPPLWGRIAGAISGIGVAYPRPPGAHRLVGRRMPDLALAAGPQSGERLYEALRHRKCILVGSLADRARSVELARPWAGRIELAYLRGAADAADAAVMLVRPDGYVGWASSESASPRRDAALHDALERWCGKPGAPRSAPPSGATSGPTWGASSGVPSPGSSPAASAPESTAPGAHRR
ncbi:MAG TPA: FAD-dependent monooxygenase [Steroidobacteraceae bacterium]|nr:FAD-dependent monooxygenase [Steroidobacteraceae bacterium]